MHLELNVAAAFEPPGAGPAGLAWDGSLLWLADRRVGRLFGLDAAGVRVRRSLNCPGNLGGLTWDGRHLWQAIFDEGMMRAVNPETNDFDRTLLLGDYGWLAGAAWDGQQLWVVAQQQGRLLAVDRDSGQVTRTLTVPAGVGGGLTFHEGLLWLSVVEGMRYDPQRREFKQQNDDHTCSLLQLDPADGRLLSRVAALHLYLGLAWAGDDLWLSHLAGAKLYRATLGR